jgi:hypothetical protein
LALSRDGTTLFVAESGGRVTAYEAESGVALRTLDLAPLGYSSLGGLAVLRSRVICTLRTLTQIRS